MTLSIPEGETPGCIGSQATYVPEKCEYVAAFRLPRQPERVRLYPNRARAPTARKALARTRCTPPGAAESTW